MSKPTESTERTALEARRYVGLDAHRDYVVVAGVDPHQRIVIEPKRLTYGAFQRWAKGHLTSDDWVVIESTTNTWHMYDELVPLCGSVTIANPAKIALIARARVKTDAKDALTLAKLHAAGLIEPVWVPPIHVREARALIAHRAPRDADRTADAPEESAACGVAAQEHRSASGRAVRR